MSIADRLEAVGVSKARFAELLDVGASSVSNMIAANKLTERAEAKLRELEAGGTGVHIPPGNLVRQGEEVFRVIRRDHCVNLKGAESWIYWISPAKKVEGGYATNGQTTRCPEKLLTDLGVVEWVEFEKPDQTKGKS